MVYLYNKPWELSQYLCKQFPPKLISGKTKPHPFIITETTPAALSLDNITDRGLVFLFSGFGKEISYFSGLAEVKVTAAFYQSNKQCFMIYGNEADNL